MKKSRCFKTALVILFMVVFVWGLLPVGAEEVESAADDSGDYRPGKTNPVSNPARWRLMAKDILGDATHNYDQGMLQYWNAPTNDYLHDWYNLSGANDWHVPVCNLPAGPVALAKGRVWSILKDDTFMAFYSNVGGAVKPVVGLMNDPTFNWTLPGTYYDSGLPFGTWGTIEIATGDIDGEVNESGERLDEIIVAYRKKNPGGTSSGYSVWLTALKSSSAPSFTVLDSITPDNPEVDPGYNFMSLTTGDYDNDGKAEIAVAFKTNVAAVFHLCLFDYEKGKLVQKEVHADPLVPASTYNLVDLTSGDFDGDGPDEIAAIYGRCTSGHDDTTEASNWIYLYKLDENLEIVKQVNYNGGPAGIISNKGTAITSGFFKYDPDNGFSVARRQLAVISMAQYKEERWGPYIFLVDIGADLSVSKATWINGRGWLGRFPLKYDVACLKPEITAGRFLTLKNGEITDQIAASWGHTPYYGWHSVMIFNIYNAKGGVLSIPGDIQSGYGFASGIAPRQNYSVWNNTSVPIVAACTEVGESYYLGVPVHITVPNFISSVRIIQEPPKHLDYLPGDSCESGKPCEWEIVNVSKFDDFYASFEESTTKSIETKSTSQTTMDVGSSEKTTAKETVEAGIPDIASADISSSQSEKVSYDYKSVTKKLNGNYSSVTFGEEFDTSADDALQLKTVWLDIWRYPVYGLKTQENKNAFYEVILPGNESYRTIAGTAASDYYQPIHENGNLLSYPWITDSKFPYDLGSFEVEGHSYQEVMTLPHDLSYGGIEETYYVGWASKTWQETTTTQKKTIKESQDFKIGFKAKAEWEWGGASFSEKFDFSSHDNSSWSNSSYSESETTTDGRVTVKVPDADVDLGYSFRPILYTTTDGTLKLAHTVAPDKSADFWQHHYHGQPDLSLNLPMKFYWQAPSTKPAYGKWYLQPYRQERSRMRGLFLYLNDPETNKGKERYLAGSPTAGETIYVQAYVYNYSLDTEAGPFTVRFSYAPYDLNLDDQAPDLTLIGDFKVGTDKPKKNTPLKPLERREVSVKWDIPKDAGGNKSGYVIYVTLDPDNEVTNEIHELYVEDQSPKPIRTCPVILNDKPTHSAECGIFCGSNNQGYWPWDNSFKIFPSSTEAEGEVPLPLELRFKPDTMELEPTAQSEAYWDRVFTDMEYRIKVVIEANRADKDFREVFFYDNDRVFSMRRSFGLNAGENDFYCRWTPEKPGEHTLKVEISEDEDDPEPGNNTVSLDVEVLDIKIPDHR